MIKHKVGDLARLEGYSYWQFAQKLKIGTRTARDLYENPYYPMSMSTLNKCCKFFNLNPGDLLEYEKDFDEKEKDVA